MYSFFEGMCRYAYSAYSYGMPLHFIWLFIVCQKVPVFRGFLPPNGLSVNSSKLVWAAEIVNSEVGLSASDLSEKSWIFT